MQSITESNSLYNNLETQSTSELLNNINQEDFKIADAVKQIIPQLTLLIDEITKRFNQGGRLFYIGAGTSGRLGILDASEILPTFGVANRIIGIIAGGDTAIRNPVEGAEDNQEQAWKDLLAYQINSSDTLIGITASGRTPYVLGGIKEAKKNNILTAGITNNPQSALSQCVDYPIEINVGPEFLTGSTRMKSGTSQKLVLNMISTALMIRCGRVKGNKMVNMQLTNIKLVDRGVRFVMEFTQLDYQQASELLKKYGSVQEVISHYKKNKYMNSNVKIGIIGTGNLGEAIAKGLMKSGFVSPENLVLSRRNVSAIEHLKQKGCHVTSNNIEVVKACKVVLVCVKPFNYVDILNECKKYFKKDHIVISTISGVWFKDIEKILGADLSLVRAMPNTAIEIQESLTALCENDNVNEHQKQFVEEMFKVLGTSIFIEEKLMDAVTVLGACGIAFALRYIRANIQGGIEIGFDAKTAAIIVNQTVKGAAELLIQNGNHPEYEIDRVTTPKGCTIVGINEMEHQGFSSSLIKGLITSFKKINP